MLIRIAFLKAQLPFIPVRGIRTPETISGITKRDRSSYLYPICNYSVIQ